MDAVSIAILTALVLIVIISIIMVAIPVAASWSICVPKWWDTEVDPILHKEVGPDIFKYPKKLFQLVILAPLMALGTSNFIQFLGRLCLYLIFKFVNSCEYYINAWFALVEEKCPYNNKTPDTGIHIKSIYEIKRDHASRELKSITLKTPMGY